MSLDPRLELHPNPIVEVQAPSELQVQALQSDLNIGPYLAKCLINRGYADPARAQQFLYPTLQELENPRLLPDFDKGRAIVLDAIDRGHKIFINGDYDADGVTSTTIFTRCLSKLGANIEPFIPQRSDGFGISKDAVIDAHKRGAKILLSCDCGSSSVESVRIAKSLGMMAVVTDHHLPDAELPPADAIINPHLKGSKYPFQDLSGAGVVFKFLYGVMQEKNLHVPFAQKYLDLAAIGTVADVMPLVGENRVISTLGIPQIIASNKPGIKALLELIDPKGQVTSRSRLGWKSLISHRIAPRINAGGRVADATLALELFLSSDKNQADRLAHELDTHNSQRRSLVDQICKEIDDRLQTPGWFIVEGDESWNPGVVGIVAGRLSERYNRPALVFGWDEQAGAFKGSMRTQGLLHAKEAIASVNDLMVGGGHEAAAGGTLISGTIDELRERLGQFAETQLTPEALVQTFRPDFEVDLGTFNLKDAEELLLLEPTGNGNPGVLALMKSVEVLAINPIGKELEHAKLIIKSRAGKEASVLVWRVSSYRMPVPGQRVNLLVEPSINEFRSDRTVQWTAIEILFP